MRASTSTRSGRVSRGLAAAGVGAALLLGGCTSAPAAGTDDAREEQEVGPLGEYFERLYGDQSPEEMEAQMREVEELTAACMQEQGFDYSPMDTSSFSDVMVEGDDVDYGSEEYVATHGYGMTTWEAEAEEVPEDEAFADPNADYVATMSESEQAAFYEALYGPMEEIEESDPEAEMAEYDWSTAGCSGEAQHEVEVASGVSDPYSDPAFASLQEEMDQMYSSLESSPELAAVDAEWAECMADAGYPGYSTQMDAMDDISARSEELYSATTEDSPEPDAAALEELQQVEIDTALADHRCKEDVEYDETYQEVSLEAEEAFVEAHRAELDAWVESSGQDQ